MDADDTYSVNQLARLCRLGKGTILAMIRDDRLIAKRKHEPRGPWVIQSADAVAAGLRIHPETGRGDSVDAAFVNLGQQLLDPIEHRLEHIEAMLEHLLSEGPTRPRWRALARWMTSAWQPSDTGNLRRRL